METSHKSFFLIHKKFSKLLRFSQNRKIAIASFENVLAAPDFTLGGSLNQVILKHCQLAIMLSYQWSPFDPLLYLYFEGYLLQLRKY